jgi:hypothetical protein
LFKKATKEQIYLRMALDGPAGSGKTYTALKVGQALAELAGGRMACLDSEAGNAKKYADVFDFDHAPLGDYSPDSYTKGIKAAVEGGYKVVVVDSLSHAWAAAGGALDQADKASVRTGNKYTAWREVTPKHNLLVETILNSPIHVIATMRSKMEYVLETNEKGKQVPRKVGLAPVQREGMEYEFDVVASCDFNHNVSITKTRCSAIDGGVYSKPGAELADILHQWLTSGVPVAPRLPTLRQPHTPADESDTVEIELVATLKAAKSLTEVQSLIPAIKQLPPEAQARVRPIYSSVSQQLQA